LADSHQEITNILANFEVYLPLETIGNKAQSPSDWGDTFSLTLIGINSSAHVRLLLY